MTLTLVQARRTAGKKGYRIYGSATSDGVGSRKHARLMHIRMYMRASGQVYVSMLTEAEGLGCFHKITVGRRRGGTTGTVVEGNK